MKRPNVLVLFADQWRAHATGFDGNAQVETPHLDALADESVQFKHAIAGVPVCTPSRACFLTGQTALTHGLFVNDVPLNTRGTSAAEAFQSAGYQTAYIGKWHINNHGRANPVPPDRRLGFDYWKALECTHNYNNSFYYEGDSTERRVWDGYDAFAQTKDAERYIRERGGSAPFFLTLAWGPPHAPYHTAPDEYRARFNPDEVQLPPNVPAEVEAAARRDLAGYYAHCAALDDCVGSLLQTLRETGQDENTLLLFTSDHGDMLGSQGLWKKQCPWEESIRVPFLLRCPAKLGREGRVIDGAAIDLLDAMPTLLGLAEAEIPDTMEGADFSACVQGGAPPNDGAVVTACYHPFGQWRADNGCPSLGEYLRRLNEEQRADILKRKAGREYRGLRTPRYSYVRSLEGPWLLYDLEKDPHQLNNLIGSPEASEVQGELDAWLSRRLEARGDAFLPGQAYLEEWGYQVNAHGTVPYTG